MEHFNRLTPAEAERLALLAEEMGEAIQAIGKVLRHGYESRHPEGGPTNREALEHECGDVRHAMIRLCDAGDLSFSRIATRQIGSCAAGDLSKKAIHDSADEKAESVGRFLHHQVSQE